MKNFLFILSVISTSIYIGSSGGFQPFVLILILTGLFFIISDLPRFLPSKISSLLVVFFLIYTIFVNLFWSLSAEETIISAYQQVFNLFIFVSFFSYFKLLSLRGARAVAIWLVIVVLVYLILAVLGIGRYTFAPRYNAFFNDPNQMAYWLLCVIVITSNLDLLEKTNSKRRDLISWIAGFITSMLFTKSRSGMVGFIIYFSRFINVKFFLLVVPVIILALAVFSEFFQLLPNLLRLSGLAIDYEIEQRGIFVPFDYPQYLFFGSGHGNYERFNLPHEVHSSLFGSFLYYGIPATLIFVFAVLFSKIPISSKISFLALLAYGITTYGFRTPIFWIAIASILNSGFIKHKQHEKVK